MIELEIPTEIHDNIAWVNGRPWAFYRVLPITYTPKSDREKEHQLHESDRFFRHLQDHDFYSYFWTIEKRFDWNRYLDNLAKSAPDRNRDAAANMVKAWKELIAVNHFAPEEDFIMAVELPLPVAHQYRWITQTFRIPARSLERMFWRWGTVFTDEKQATRRREDAVRRRIDGTAIPLQSHEIADFYRHHFNRGITMKPFPTSLKGDWKAGQRNLAWLSEGIVTGHMRYVHVEQENEERYMAFVTLATTPDEMYVPGHEVFYRMSELDFPVERMIRWRHIASKQAQTMARRKKMDVKDVTSHISDVDEVPLQAQEQQALAAELELHMQHTKPPLLESYVVFCVDGESEEEVSNRATALINFLDDLGCRAARPTGDQELYFINWLPSIQWYPRGYKHNFLPQVAGAIAMPGCADRLGDPTGIPVGFSRRNSLVRLDPARGPQMNKSASMAITGPLGSGKSFLVNTLIYISVLIWNASAFVVDPKGERKHWNGILPGLEDVVTALVLDGRKHPGALDPFRITSDLGHASEMAVSIVDQLISKSQVRSEQIHLLTAAKETRNDREPSMMRFLEHLANIPQAHEISQYLNLIRDLTLGELIFGEPSSTNLIPSSGLITLGLAGLTLPDAGKEPEDLRQKVSVAVMKCTALMAETFVLKATDGSFRLAVMDEAWTWLRTQEGKNLADRLERAGRAANAGIWFCTQNPSDLPGDLLNNIETYICLGTKEDHETDLAIKALGLQNTEFLRTQLQTRKTKDDKERDEFTSGQGYMKDLQGQAGWIQFYNPLPNLREIFNTTPEATAASLVMQ